MHAVSPGNHSSITLILRNEIYTDIKKLPIQDLLLYTAVLDNMWTNAVSQSFKIITLILRNESSSNYKTSRSNIYSELSNFSFL